MSAADPLGLLQRRDRMMADAKRQSVLRKRDALMDTRVEKRLDPKAQLASLDAQIAALQAQRDALRKGRK